MTIYKLIATDGAGYDVPLGVFSSNEKVLEAKEKLLKEHHWVHTSLVISRLGVLDQIDNETVAYACDDEY